jgi:hypothetical protein
MPAPQASMMQQLARAKFTSFNIKVPQNWKDPVGDPAEKHYRDAFKPEERSVPPGMPPLVSPATPNKYHVDAQKMHIDKIGSFIDGICSAICSAWSTWQTAATMSGIVINAVTAAGGMLVGPPWTPLIMASAPKVGPSQLKYSNAVANVIGTAWQTFTATVKVPGLPWYPAFAAFPGPMAPPMPNVPVPFAALTQVPASISVAALKGQMVAQLGDPMAPFHAQLFESIADAFDKCYNTWKVSTQVTNVLGTGPIPTFAPPYVPVGPVVGGMGTMTPGGLV